MDVWAGWTFEPKSRYRGQLRGVIAARSKAAVMRATGLSRSHMENYWGTTGNEAEIEVAMQAPGVLFVRPLDSRDPEDWEQITPAEIASR